ncbi:MAG: hypothetical protein Q8L48_24310 [Archangium sp.]|nr:hypothetical protein [Archangium sp.]
MARRLLPLLIIAACVRTTPQPPPEPSPPPAPVFLVPPGCLAPLSGTWVHATNPAYRYEADDDGGTVTLVVSRQYVVDAGFSPRRFRQVDGGVDAGIEVDAGQQAAASPVRVELQRTGNGFSGATLAPLIHPSGRVCEGRFPTTVLSCADGGLLLETQSATALGDACQAPARPLGLLTQQHQLVRPDAG